MLSVPEWTSFTWQLSVKTAAENPRFIIVGFQTDKDGNQTKNPYTFDHMNLKIAYITLISDRYQRLIIICRSLTRNCLVYGDAALFGVKSFVIDELLIT